jgi:hypothetical protein
MKLHPDSNLENRWQSLKLGEGFFRDVRAMFYGDDNIMNVKDGVSWFNHTSISSYLRSKGVTYTMADKDQESTPYISGNEITFLKRSFRYELEVNGYVAPLELTSVYKALMLTIPSKVVSKEKAYIDCIVSQNDTAWHYGKEEFHRIQCMLKELINHCDLGSYMGRPLLTFDELSARWLATRDSPEIKAWEPNGSNITMQSGQSHEAIIFTTAPTRFTNCDMCGRCPYSDLEDDEYEVCQLCGGCTLEGDPWCIVCREDGFCECGNVLTYRRRLYREGIFCLVIFLGCSSCDSIRVIHAPLTRRMAIAYSIPWSQVEGSNTPLGRSEHVL